MARELYSLGWDRMTFDEQKVYRDRKLSYFVRTQLYPYSPFYRKMFDENSVKPEQIKHVEDLRRLPFTYKEDIAPTPDDPSRFRQFVIQPDDELMDQFMPKLQLFRMRADRVFKGADFVKKKIWRKYSPEHIQFTTGHTGFPTPIVYARDDVERMTEASRRILELAGFGTRVPYDEAVVVNAMPFAPHLAFWMVAKGLDSTGILSLHTGGGRAMGTWRIIAAVENMKATGLVGMPGYTYRLLRTAAEHDRDFSTIRVVLVAGERVPQGMKERMSEFLESMGAKDFYLLSALGFTEARKSYSECVPDADTGYHLFPDLDYVELIDPESGEPVDEGEDGELVYTCLEGQGTCVLRFRTGDFVKGGIVYEPCPSCGRMVPRLGSDITRLQHEHGLSLTKIKGTLVDHGAFFTVLKNIEGVREWQVEIRKAEDDPYDIDVVDVYIAPEEGVNNEVLKEEIESALQVATEVKPSSIEFMSIDELVSRMRVNGGIKEIHVDDKRPKA